MKNIIICGAGDCGKEWAAFIEQINKIQPTYNIVGMLDKANLVGSKCWKYDIIGTDEDFASLVEKYDAYAVTATQKWKIRKKIVEMNPSFARWATIIHPSAVIDDSVTIGMGTVVGPGAVINVDAKIGKHCIISSSSTVGHDCIVGDYASLMPGCVCCGHTQIGEMAYISTNASVIPGVKVGIDSVIGVASTALEDVPDKVMIFGNPGRITMKRK